VRVAFRQGGALPQGAAASRNTNRDLDASIYGLQRIYANFPLHVENNFNDSQSNLLRTSLREHLEAIQSLLDSKLDEIEQAGLLIFKTLRDGNKVLICGNGGSAADAQHIAAEFLGRYEQERRSFPAIALTTDTSALTALSNDYGYEQVFARQVQGLAVAGDLLIAISTSGKSPNVIRAAEEAKGRGCKVIGLTGCNGEPLATHCDIAIVVPASRTSRVQEAHITIGHLWCEMVDMLAV
jgi:D-sedoheptulose 7-phosphate isomerase